MSESQKNQLSGLRKLGYASAVIGGGVVGSDYATCMEVNPAVGAIVGSVIGSILTKILYYLQDDPDRQILGFLMKAGMLLGAIAGGYFGYEVGMTEDQKSVLIYSGVGTLGGGFAGAVVGRIVSGLVSLSAFTLLFISRGPVGAYLRNLASQSNAEEALQTSSLPESFFSAIEFIGNFMH